MNMETGYAPVAEGQLYYEVAGQGPALVLTHAAVAERRMWDPQMAPFAEHYRVIRYDIRGFGRSSDAQAPFSFHQDLHDLLTHLGVTQAHVLGLSLGGSISLSFALAYPAMVRSLVLAAAGAGGRQPSPLLQQIWAQVEALADQGRMDDANELEVHLWVDGPGRTPEAVDPAIRERVRAWNLATFTRPESDGKPQPLDPPAGTRLGEVQAATLIIVGDQDVPDVLTDAERLATQIPGARKIVIPGAAHMINMEKPAEFNRIVLDFLAQFA